MLESVSKCITKCKILSQHYWEDLITESDSSCMGWLERVFQGWEKTRSLRYFLGKCSLHRSSPINPGLKQVVTCSLNARIMRLDPRKPFKDSCQLEMLPDNDSGGSLDLAMDLDYLSLIGLWWHVLQFAGFNSLGTLPTEAFWISGREEYGTEKKL